MQQTTLFDYIDHLQAEDNVRQQLEQLHSGAQTVIGGLAIRRDERFYVVSKQDDFEEPFTTLEAAYQFINHIQEW